ncbi:ABC transporter substrate-binding protein [Paenibacillus sp. N3.4]|uniref:ABC transporter substrate-binding protein n=1 Tax=Paenibacillus sp. N3.4 TaxID=2603222 RepID=UPI0011C76FDA|nr:ABC transporter substrate-binding protein [Paenibacillus sp. N3.4]TXK77648.1 ABC transporter substrate-binding protein [Paenibacillus sp. N3.4]
MLKGKKQMQGLSVAMLSLSIVLAGCSSNSNQASGTTTPSSNPSSSVKPTQSELPPYQIDWYIIGSGPQADNELVEAEINKITQPAINATVKMHIISFGDYDSKMTASLATGEKVDLMFTSNGNMNYNTMVGKGAFVDLTDKLDKLAPDAKKLLSEGFLQASAIKGRNYTLAAYKEKGSWLGIIASKNLMDKYKIDISQIKSIEDMEPALKIIKENEPSITPLLATALLSRAPNYNNREFWNVSPIQSLFMKKDGSAYALELDEPAYMSTLKTMNKYYKAGYIPADAPVKKINNDDKAKSAFMLTQLKPYVDVQVGNSLGIPMVYQNFGKPITTTNDLVGSMMAIPTNSKNPDRVLMFYNMMYANEKLINLVGRGIEGKHYVKKGEKRIDYAPDTDNGKKSGYKPNTTWAYGNQFQTYLMPGEPDDIWAQFKKFNDESEIVPDLGFNFDSSTLTSEVAAIKNAESEFRPILETGSVDPEVYVPKFKEKLKAAGIDKVLQEMNKQYESWKASGKK